MEMSKRQAKRQARGMQPGQRKPKWQRRIDNYLIGCQGGENKYSHHQFTKRGSQQFS